MKSRVAIVAAMARELRPLVRNWKLEKFPLDVRVYSSAGAIAAFAGMGKRRAEIAAQAALSFGPVHRLVSAGWAGSLHGGICVGTVRFARAVIDAATGERFEQENDSGEAAADSAVLVTTDYFVSRAEKLHLRATYAADMVDMEAAAVARVARANGISFFAIKAISDAHDFDLPELGRFAGPEGRFRDRAFGAYVGLRPRLWKPVFHLGRNSAVAARLLCAELERYLAEDGKRARL